MRVFLIALLGMAWNLALMAQNGNPYQALEKELARYRFKAAEAHLSSLPDSLQQEPKYYAYKAQIFRNLGDFPQAARAYERALALDSQSVSLRMAWAKMEIDRHNYPRAGVLYRQLITQDTGNPYFYKQLAYLELKRQSSVGAMSAFMRVLELAPRDFESAAQLIRLYLDLKIYDRADSLLNHFLAYDQENRILNQLSLHSAFAQKQYPRMQVHGQKLVSSLKDSNFQVLKMLGIAYYHLQNYASADTFLTKALSLTEQNDKLYFYLGMTKIAREDYDAGQNYLEQAIEAGTNEALPVYRLNLALVLDDQERYKEAIGQYKRVWLETHSAVVLYYLARDYDEYYRDKSQALNYYQQFLEKAGSEYYRYQQYSRERISEIKKIEHFRAEWGARFS